MKKIFLFLVLFAFSFSIKAQTIKSVGLKVGRSSATQYWNYKSANIYLEQDFKSGFYTAINLELFSKKYLSLVTDLSFCQKGYSQQVSHTTYDMPQGDGTYYEIGARHNYISFSPMLKIRKENSHFIPYLIIGPRIDYQMGYETYFISRNPNEFKKLVLGLTGGVGLEYKFKQFGVGLEFQVQYDFTKIIDTQPTINNTGLAIENFAMVMAGNFKYYLNNN